MRPCSHVYKMTSPPRVASRHECAGVCNRPVLLSLIGLALASPSSAQLTVRVVDVGPGLCTVTEASGADGPHYMVYDAGHWLGQRCLGAVREIVGAAAIDLLIISHPDSDHLGDAARET